MNQPGLPQQDEVDLVGVLLFLRKNFLFIITVIVLAMATGALYIFLTPPEYQSQTVFLLKKGDEGGENSNILSRLGGVGRNMVSLGIGGSGSSLQDRAEFILKSRELAETVIASNNLLPRLYPEKWDAKNSKWKDGVQEPKLEQAVAFLRASIAVGVKKGFFTLAVTVKNDRVFARDLVDAYLKALNAKIQLDAKHESTENQKYLELALGNTLDPTVQEKIQNRIAFEIEKYMLVSTNSLDVLEKPVAASQKSAPKNKMVMILSLMTGVLAALFLVMILEFAKKLRANYKRRASV